MTCTSSSRSRSAFYAVTRDEFAEFVRETNTPMDGGYYYWDGKETLDPTRSFLDPKMSVGPQAGDHPVFV